MDPDRTGFGALTETWGDNLVFDKNADGHPDVLLSYHFTQGWEIWLGTGGSDFTLDRTLKRKDRHNCQAADFAGVEGGPDGLMDMYCVRGANEGTRDDKRNELLIQQPDGSFVNTVLQWGAVDPSGRGRTVTLLNIRGDGVPSLFVGNKEANLHPSEDHIFENIGGRFRERRTGGLPSERDSDCSSTGDFDRDGRQDFLSCSFSLRLYRNLTSPGGRVSYPEVSGHQGLPSGHVLDAELVNLNKDRWRDLVTVTKDALRVRLNRRTTPHFPTVDYTLPLGAGTSFCSGHANGDKAKDLLIVQGLASHDDDLQRADRMLINTGTGKQFMVSSVPQPPTNNGRNGNGDTCSAIPDYRGPRAAWTINNGRAIYGPNAHERLGYRQLVILAP